MEESICKTCLRAKPLPDVLIMDNHIKEAEETNPTEAEQLWSEHPSSGKSANQSHKYFQHPSRCICQEPVGGMRTGPKQTRYVFLNVKLLLNTGFIQLQYMYKVKMNKYRRVSQVFISSFPMQPRLRRLQLRQRPLSASPLSAPGRLCTHLLKDWTGNTENYHKETQIYHKSPAKGS